MIMDNPIEEIIREEAYAIYKTREREGIAGTEKGDWLEAERKLRLRLVDDVISLKLKSKLEGGY